jgi:hypothetical protein
VSTGYGTCRWDGGWGERENTTWEEKPLILGWIDERKEIAGFGEWQGKRPGAGLVYVDVDVEISIDLVTRDSALYRPQGK